jgi:hypothetical protein
VTPEQVIFTAPANAANRNGPDIGFNADPQTGHEVIYTSDGTDFAKGQDTITGFGGTSFVGPQLDGVTAIAPREAWAHSMCSTSRECSRRRRFESSGRRLLPSGGRRWRAGVGFIRRAMASSNRKTESLRHRVQCAPSFWFWSE